MAAATLTIKGQVTVRGGVGGELLGPAAALGWSSPETLLGAPGTAPKTAMRRARRSGTPHRALVGGPQQPFVGVGAHRADFSPTATNR